jgi:hypothetical protein
MPQSRTLSIGLEVHKASIAVAYAAKDSGADAISQGGESNGTEDERSGIDLASWCFPSSEWIIRVP